MGMLSMAAAIPIVKAAVFAALAPLVGDDPTGLPRCYWQQAPDVADTLDGPDPDTLIFQSQDNGGKAAPYLGSRGWSGLIAVKAYAATDDGADALIAAVEGAMAGITAAEGYTLAILEVSPLTIPADSGGAAGLLYRLSLNEG